ncbi:MAG: helicase-related protein, partial [Chloroflexota bacterium]|nr:helicase-related protein [Chloroflexota bacterium]
DTPCIRLLLGSTSDAERTEIANGLQDGSIKILIGTHALIQDSVQFSNLALAVVDEQHRFGGEQRAALRGKGDEPHLMVMTATPIPRSLALTLYGDLDLSIIDELPPGRRPVETRVVHPTQRKDMYNFISAQIKNGGQAFMIYPIIEESDTLQVRAAVKEHKRLQNEVFSKFRVGLLHGKMKADDKYHEITNFRNGDIDILVSTTVIEVGVDIPNASIIVIENANRFGLAQLHQLRGRVGRGEHKSYCLLVAEEKKELFAENNKSTNDRLKIMESTTDGFVLAEKDLQLRGPGDFLGTHQTGFSFQLANLSDMALIQLTLTEAETLLNKDPELNMPEHSLLANVIFNNAQNYMTKRSS